MLYLYKICKHNNIKVRLKTRTKLLNAINDTMKMRWIFKCARTRKFINQTAKQTKYFHFSTLCVCVSVCGSLSEPEKTNFSHSVTDFLFLILRRIFCVTLVRQSNQIPNRATIIIIKIEKTTKKPILAFNGNFFWSHCLSLGIFVLERKNRMEIVIMKDIYFQLFLVLLHVTITIWSVYNSLLNFITCLNSDRLCSITECCLLVMRPTHELYFWVLRWVNENRLFFFFVAAVFTQQNHVINLIRHRNNVISFSFDIQSNLIISAIFSATFYCDFNQKSQKLWLYIY